MPPRRAREVKKPRLLKRPADASAKQRLAALAKQRVAASAKQQGAASAKQLGAASAKRQAVASKRRRRVGDAASSEASRSLQEAAEPPARPAAAQPEPSPYQWITWSRRKRLYLVQRRGHFAGTAKTLEEAVGGSAAQSRADIAPQRPTLTLA